MALSSIFLSPSSLLLLLTTAPLLLLTHLLHRAFFSPLSSVPGPLIARFTSLWIWYHSYLGDECRLINILHARYGPVLRIAPNEVIIADGAALAPIYSERGGFKKADCYKNFDFEGHATIFSARDAEYRAKRSKAVVGMFSTGNVRGGREVLEGCVGRFVERAKLEKEKKGRVDMLNLARSLALDAVSSYLFGKTYGGLEEEGEERLSAADFVDEVVAFGRFFFLPNWVFVPVLMASEKLFARKEAVKSAMTVDEFSKRLVDEAGEGDETYQGRFKKAGISEEEIKIQCNDLIFAGTDSTGTNVATICWWLAKHPSAYQALRHEVASADAADPTGFYNPQTLPHLDAIVREGLRISMANPTRLPRVVPSTGWSFTCSSSNQTNFFPAGTMVSCQPYTLHHNPLIFPEPFEFKPERWLEGNVTAEMQRDAIPFGLGARQCIARNLAQMEVLLAIRAVAREGLLEGAKPVGERIEVKEWFNSVIVGEKVELVWE